MFTVLYDDRQVRGEEGIYVFRNGVDCNGEKGDLVFVIRKFKIFARKN